jgi:ubiquinone/menaquinone biosynthesis C-methylase UbiE
MSATGFNPGEKRFHGGAGRLSAPERLARLQVDTVVGLCLEGAAVGSVLDAGTGTGIFAAAFTARGLRVTGVDINAELLRQARAEVPGAEFQAADLERLPMAEKSFDLVFLGLVLHETDDPLAALREARRVAKARVAVLEWPYRREEHGPPLEHRLPPDRIRQLAQEAGYSRVESLGLAHTDLYLLTP